MLPSGDERPYVDGLRVGGLSACAFDLRESLLWAASDARENPRVFQLGVRVGAQDVSVEPERVLVLQDAIGEWRSLSIADLEGFAFVPGRGFLVSIEGDSSATPRLDPVIALVEPQGRVVQVLPLPDAFVGRDADAPAQPRGVRPNAGFESLTYRARDGVVFTGVEQPLLQDDDEPTLLGGARSRLAEFVPDGESWRPGRQFAYWLDPVPVPSDFGPSEGMNGLVELLALDDDLLLALERSFVRERAGEQVGERRGANSIRIYQVWLDGADDVSGVPSLRGTSVRAAEKALVLSLDSIATHLPSELARLDNFEGMCVGPRLADGTPTLVLVSDDNFNGRQRTAFVLLRLTRLAPRAASR